MHNSFFDRLLNIPRAYKLVAILLADLLVLPLAVYSAHVLRFADFWPEPYISNNAWMFYWVLLAGPIIFALLGLYRAVVRYMGWHALSTVLLGSLMLSASFYIVSVLFVIALPRSLPIIFFLLSVLYVAGTRAFFRQYYRRYMVGITESKKAIVYGAGSAGVQLMQALNVTGLYKIVVFVDDDARKWKTTIRGVSVKSPQELPHLLRNKSIDEVLLAMPSASASQRKRVLDQLADYPVLVQTVPAMTDILTGKAQVTTLREVEIEELLGRDAVPPLDGLLRQNIHQHSVMVTGAGGSIGSELCRQIATHQPSCLVLLDMSEYALYAIHQELSAEFPQVFIYPVLGSVVDSVRLQEVMRQFAVHTLYHAAAYKHVPLVEHNIVEGVRNNVLGSLAVVQSALAIGIKHCVLISTDKAVRPTNVMGATKRLAEQLFQDAASQTQVTCFSMVRFGNVLGSSGSVVPVFREQLANGGPVTVTHPEITRYFMTIPEAASLVIQAGAMAQGGDVFVLDMGEPVKIVDLAKRMIHLSGLEVRDALHPDGDIDIQFTGLRPGEKLYEELLIGDNVVGTDHPKIMRANESCLPTEQLMALFGQLEAALEERSPLKVRELMMQLVPEFNPSSECVDWLHLTSEASP